MSLRKALRNGPLLLDGGMGSLLQAEGLRPGEAPETWNLSHPERITAIHRAYYEAGSQLVLANTFGVHPLRYSPAECGNMIRAGIACVKAARREAGGGKDRYIGMDLGPCGKLLRPLGTVEFEEAVGYYAEVVRIGAECGAD